MRLDNTLFTRYWHLGCHRRELANEGDFVRLTTVVGDVVMYNDGDDIVAFDNRCAHRGARIYEGECGNQAPTCKYHGWTYRNGMTIIPERERFHDCNIEAARLRAFATEWCGDFLFFSVAPAHTLEAQLGESARMVEDISFNIDRRIDHNAYDYPCYWPLAIENALESYHVAMVHADTLMGLELEDGEDAFFGDNSIIYAPIGNARLSKQLKRLRPLFEIDFQYEGYMSLYLFPFSMISSTYGYSYSIQSFFPKAGTQDTSNFISRLYTAPTRAGNAAAILASFFDSSVKMNREIFKEDADVCNLLAPDTWSMQPLRYMSERERKISHFRESCRRAMSEPPETAHAGA